MKAGDKFLKRFFGLLVFALITLAAANVRADLSAKQARKALTRMAGFELKGGDVKVTATSTTGATTGEATALIRGVFRFEQDAQARWRIAEVRTGPNTWEEINLIARALNGSVDLSECNAAAPPARSAAVEPSVKRTRCLLGSLFGIKLPSDEVRIQEVAPFAIPLASQPSTTVIAWIQVYARLVNQSKAGWQVTELRTGKRDWIKLESVLSALNESKRETARADLTAIAQALERFRSERGAYLVADKHSVAIDHLSPRFLSRVIRVDPWHQPYSYLGQRDRYTLSSSGPDGKEATADDIIVTSPAQ
ncbi:MAG TPA: type II secretion system protein GspG [Pyrinomonadaceae bacterium]|nr:type II secretion system protein GspG [Pyrinomonadaceae bacterium]